ncbi:hypothetical protein PSTG_18463 [Puccinia striiformis f. sp. tritici PST-78]|uniref:Uncharacterized protein n=1 Tax=Puccinia striiformis f. sp. tritici PST-78 TaxID=1165861 RepID=A0A0L0UM45_9BASI|nr:hypothetical protein PSTG_18463 [Puccinia striiformis f. sp. tritici PST-78]
MFDPMIKILKKYLNLALRCDTVVMATFLHPSWRMMLFTNRFPDHLTRIIGLTSKKFNERAALLKSLQPETLQPKNTQSETNASPEDSDSGTSGRPRAATWPSLELLAATSTRGGTWSACKDKRPTLEVTISPWPKRSPPSFERLIQPNGMWLITTIDVPATSSR